ncbi:MAG TPA: hypothetical protein VII12_05015 [Thermoanaerobaculia bacterium]
MRAALRAVSHPSAASINAVSAPPAGDVIPSPAIRGLRRPAVPAAVAGPARAAGETPAL